MYRAFEARNFRCFEDLKVAPLKRLNLVTGLNNVGKTALLEALWLHHGYHNPTLGSTTGSLRGVERVRKDDFLRHLFRGFDLGRRIELVRGESNDRSRRVIIKAVPSSTSEVPMETEGDLAAASEERRLVGAAAEDASSAPGWEFLIESFDEAGRETTARASFNGKQVTFTRAEGVKEPNAIFLAARAPHRFSTLAERLSNIAVEKKDEDVIRVLNIIEPNLKNLTVQQRAGAPMIFGDLGAEELVPLPFMGDGVGRVLNIALAVPDAENGLVLVDEIENGLHYSVMTDVWRALAELATSYDCQLFATTHSWECIRGAHEACCERDEYDFRLHRLEKGEDGIVAVTYDQEMLDAVVRTDLEAR
ncbi:MAG: AAA family ATPase [Planctomycetota bacterium]